MFNADYANAGYRWPVVRLKMGSVVQVTLLSRAYFSLTTHFYRVTIACAGDGCAFCDLLPARGLFYLAAMCDGRRSILELGVYSANDLEQHCVLLHGGMRPGLVVELSRRSKKGAVHSQVTGDVPGCGEVEPLLLAQRVLAVYKLPCCNPGETMEMYEARVQSIVRRRNAALAKTIEDSQARRV